MAEMIFFSKNGCESSEQKRVLLESAGNTLLRKDILAQNWTRETLLPFVRGRDPINILSTSAPDILMGKIDPLLLNFEQALELLAKDPILINGPLIQVENLYIQGLHDRRLDKFLEYKYTPTLKTIRKKDNTIVHKRHVIFPHQFSNYAEMNHSFA